MLMKKLRKKENTGKDPGIGRKRYLDLCQIVTGFLLFQFSYLAIELSKLVLACNVVAVGVIC